MRKFKKGDLVRCTGPNVFSDVSCIKHEGIITRDENQRRLGVDKEWTMHRDNLELIKAVKPTRKELKKKIKELKDKVENLRYQAMVIQQESESMKSDYEILVKEANDNSDYWRNEYYELKESKEETPQLQRGDRVKLIDDGIHLKKGTFSTVKKVIHNEAVQLETICCESLSKLERQ